MSAKTKSKRKEKLYYYYDKKADVLYFSQGAPSARSYSEEAADDVVLRVDSKTRKVRGFTILNFTRRMRKKPVSVSLPMYADIAPV